MSAFFEIAYAAASNRLCLFTGTGFSKAVTSNQAPSWRSLLEEVCDELPVSSTLKGILFPSGGVCPVSLEEAAEIISINLENYSEDIRIIISRIISGISMSGDNDIIKEFFKAVPLNIITTNYDKLIEELSDPDDCHSLSPGLPIPRSSLKTSVYHIHGSIDHPRHMVVTASDYFQFSNNDSYFSRKMSTLLHENTVVILGYSLGDNNLKAIINDSNLFLTSHSIGKNIFFVSNNRIDTYLKDYYAHCFGIRVIDELEIHDFFEKVTQELSQAQDIVEISRKKIREVLAGGCYDNVYLKLRSSFFEIIASLFAVGKSVDSPDVVDALKGIINQKQSLSSERNAWDQYDHLASWLVYLGTLLEINGTAIESDYLDAVMSSMRTMSKNRSIGSSWAAYDTWNFEWNTMIPCNRDLIKRRVEKENGDLNIAAYKYREIMEIINRC